MKIHYNHKDKENTIPLPATLIHELGEEISKSENGVNLKLYSKFPFPNRKERKLDSFAKDALSYFEKHPDKVYQKVETLNGLPHVRVAVADKMAAKACVNCHNNHKETPKR